jgi:nucleoside diphosphate kinase
MEKMEEYCSIIVTPDSVRRNLENIIIDEIVKRTNTQIIWKKYLKIDKEAVRFLYPKKVTKPYYASIAKNIISGKSLIVILKGEKGIITKIKQLKGRFYVGTNGRLETSGLRLKYGAQIKKHTFKENEKTTETEIYEFRLHTTENLEETAIVCALFMDSQEIIELRRSAATLYSEVQRIVKHHQIIKKLRK